MRRLNDCSDQEVVLLAAILSLVKQLPYEVAHYTRVFGEMAQRYFDPEGDSRRRGDHNPSPGSVALTRKVRATPPWK